MSPMRDWRKDRDFLAVVDRGGMFLPGSVRAALRGDAYSIDRLDKMYVVWRASRQKITEKVKDVRKAAAEKLQHKLSLLEVEHRRAMKQLRANEREDVLAYLESQPVPREVRGVYIRVLEEIRQGKHEGARQQV